MPNPCSWLHILFHGLLWRHSAAGWRRLGIPDRNSADQLGRQLQWHKRLVAHCRCASCQLYRLDHCSCLCGRFPSLGRRTGWQQFECDNHCYARICNTHVSTCWPFRASIVCLFLQSPLEIPRIRWHSLLEQVQESESPVCHDGRADQGREHRRPDVAP